MATGSPSLGRLLRPACYDMLDNSYFMTKTQPNAGIVQLEERLQLTRPGKNNPVIQ